MGDFSGAIASFFTNRNITAAQTSSVSLIDSAYLESLYTPSLGLTFSSVAALSGPLLIYAAGGTAASFALGFPLMVAGVYLTITQGFTLLNGPAKAVVEFVQETGHNIHDVVKPAINPMLHAAHTAYTNNIKPGIFVINEGANVLFDQAFAPPFNPTNGSIPWLPQPPLIPGGEPRPSFEEFEEMRRNFQNTTQPGWAAQFGQDHRGLIAAALIISMLYVAKRLYNYLCGSASQSTVNVNNDAPILSSSQQQNAAIHTGKQVWDDEGNPYMLTPMLRHQNNQSGKLSSSVFFPDEEETQFSASSRFGL